MLAGPDTATQTLRNLNRTGFVGGHFLRVARPWLVPPELRGSVSQPEPAGCSGWLWEAPIVDPILPFEGGNLH